MAMRMRQDRDRDGFTLTGQMLTLGVRSMLYEIMEQPGPSPTPPALRRTSLCGPCSAPDS